MQRKTSTCFNNQEQKEKRAKLMLEIDERPSASIRLLSLRGSRVKGKKGVENPGLSIQARGDRLQPTVSTTSELAKKTQRDLTKTDFSYSYSRLFVLRER